MKFLVIGDSLSFGSELPDLPTKHFGCNGNDYFYKDKIQYAEPSRLAWPAKLAQKLNATVDNWSLPGSSCDRTFRLAVQAGTSKEYHCIICAWPPVDRLDLTFRDRDATITVNTAPSVLKPLISDWYSTDKAIHQWLAHVVTLQSFFQQHQQQYLFVNSFYRQDSLLLNKKDKVAQDLKDVIDVRYYVDFHRGLFEWCKHLKIAAGGHFLEDGHDLVADKMYNFIKDNIVLDYK